MWSRTTERRGRQFGTAPLRLESGVLSAEVEAVVFPLAQAFTISRGTRTEAVVVECRLSDGIATGRGECVPYARYDETVESVIAQISSVALDGLDRSRLAEMLPPGAARNALDCALWDLEAKRSGKRVWELAGLPEPGPEVTAFTLSLEAPEMMRHAAEANAHRPLLKIKLGGAGDIDRLRAVRSGAPDARIVIDANEGWDAATLWRNRSCDPRSRRRDGRTAIARGRRRRAGRNGPASPRLRRRGLS